jgi:hypothetical protein
MPRIKFLEDFDYKPIPMQTYSYKKGDVALVTQDIAKKAISQNKAEYTEFKAPSSNIANTISKFKNTRPRKNVKVTKDENESLNEAQKEIPPAFIE